MPSMRNYTFSAWFILVHLILSAATETTNLFRGRGVTEGLVFPEQTSAIVGESVLLRILTPLVDQARCTYRRPGGGEDVEAIAGESISAYRIVPWSMYACGIVIRNVSALDSGPWRLTSWSPTNAVARGVGTLLIQESNNTAAGLDITLKPDQDDALALTPDGTRYCYVLRPGQSENGKYPQHKQCQLPKLDSKLDANGEWRIVAGVDGQTDELQMTVNVVAKVEELITNVRSDDGQMRLGCNLQNSVKAIEFCRFVRLTDQAGFNLEPGLGTLKYSYAGNGFEYAECGMNIKSPDAEDRVTWTCYLGFTDGTTIGALIESAPEPLVFSDINAPDVYAMNGTAVDLLCKAPIALDYCWFTNPTGLRLSVSDRTTPSADDAYSYYGTGLKLGECGLTIRVANVSDSGRWQCNVGTTTNRVGFEVNQTLAVRISGSHLVATKQYVEHRSVIDPLVLECTAVPVGLPVEYCRFVLPDGRGFSINENITVDNPLDGSFYFAPGRHMRQGFCAVSIVSTQPLVHGGAWTCAGRLVGWTEESSDDFRVNVIEESLSVGAIVGISVGAILLVAAVVGIGVYSYRVRARRLSEAEPDRQLDEAIDETPF